MNKYWHVLHTYSSRPRFWIFGLVYLFVASYAEPEAARPQIVFSVMFASIVIGLLALHLRRQFATPQAHLMPDFFTAHVIVAIFASSLVWIAVPWWEAWRMNLHPLIVISVHALTPVLLGAVIWWPKAIVLIPAVPLIAVGFVVQRRSREFDFATQFMAGEKWEAYWGLIALGVAGLAVATWRLARLPDVAVATSDDFALEPPRADLPRSPWLERMLGLRDAAIDRRLMHAVGRGALLATRRIPGTISLAELVLFSVAILAFMPMLWFVIGDVAGAWIALILGTGLMLFAPFSSWRFRCNALAMEFMRPSARDVFLRQMTCAMALDFCVWTSAATLVAACGLLMFIRQHGFNYFDAFAAQTVTMWGFAVLLFGIGLATLRFRAWMPFFIGILICSAIAALYVAAVAEGLMQRNGFRPSAYIVFSVFSSMCVLIGLALARATYRRWLTMDLT
jgi:hypothetical protein